MEREQTMNLEEIEARDWLIFRSRDSKSPSLEKAHATSLLVYIDALVVERDEARRERSVARTANEALLANYYDERNRAEAAEALATELDVALGEAIQHRSNVTDQIEVMSANLLAAYAIHKLGVPQDELTSALTKEDTDE